VESAILDGCRRNHDPEANPDIWGSVQMTSSTSSSTNVSISKLLIVTSLWKTTGVVGVTTSHAVSSGHCCGLGAGDNGSQPCRLRIGVEAEPR
jgi:hypothetical protein